jgi:hypothetical protein
MDGTGDCHAKQITRLRKTNITCFLSHVEYRSENKQTKRHECKRERGTRENMGVNMIKYIVCAYENVIMKLIFCKIKR